MVFHAARLASVSGALRACCVLHTKPLSVASHATAQFVVSCCFCDCAYMPCSVISQSTEMQAFLTTHDDLRLSASWQTLSSQTPTVFHGARKFVNQMIGREMWAPAPQEAAQPTSQSHDAVRQMREALYSMRHRGCVATGTCCFCITWRSLLPAADESSVTAIKHHWYVTSSTPCCVSAQ